MDFVLGIGKKHAFCILVFERVSIKRAYVCPTINLCVLIIILPHVMLFKRVFVLKLWIRGVFPKMWRSE